MRASLWLQSVVEAPPSVSTAEIWTCLPDRSGLGVRCPLSAEWRLVLSAARGANEFHLTKQRTVQGLSTDEPGNRGAQTSGYLELPKLDADGCFASYTAVVRCTKTCVQCSLAGKVSLCGLARVHGCTVPSRDTVPSRPGEQRYTAAVDHLHGWESVYENHAAGQRDGAQSPNDERSPASV